MTAHTELVMDRTLSGLLHEARLELGRCIRGVPSMGKLKQIQQLIRDAEARVETIIERHPEMRDALEVEE